MNQNDLSNYKTTSVVEYDPPKKRRIFPIFLVIFVLMICAFLIYFFYFYKVSARQVIDGAFNIFFDKATTLENVFDKVSDFDLKNDTLQGSFDLNLNLEGIVDGQKIDFKNIDLNYQMTTDIKNKEIFFKIGTSQNNKEIINANVLLKNDTTYFTSNLFNKTYFSSLGDTSYWQEINKAIDDMQHYNANDFKKIIEKNKLFIRNTIKDEYLSQETGSYIIDGKDISGIKTTLELTEKRQNEMEIDYYNEVLADDEYLEILAKGTKATKEELRNDYTNIVNNLKSEYNTADSINKVYFNIYTTKNGKFLAFEGMFMDEVSLTAVLNDNIITIKTYKENNIVGYTFNYDMIKKELSFEAEGYSFKVQLEENSLKILITGNNFNLNISTNTIVENNTISYIFDSSGSYTENNNSYIGSIKMTFDISKVDKMNSFNTTNAKNANEVTEEEITAIESRFENAIKGTYIESLYQIVQNTINNIIETAEYNYEEIN